MAGFNPTRQGVLMYIHVYWKIFHLPAGRGGMVSADNIWEDVKKEMITGGNYERKKSKTIGKWKVRTVNAKWVRKKCKKCDWWVNIRISRERKKNKSFLRGVALPLGKNLDPRVNQKWEYIGPGTVHQRRSIAGCTILDTRSEYGYNIQHSSSRGDDWL